MLGCAVQWCAVVSERWCVLVQFATSRGVPTEFDGIAPGEGPPLTSYPILPVAPHHNPFIGPIGEPHVHCCRFERSKLFESAVPTQLKRLIQSPKSTFEHQLLHFFLVQLLPSGRDHFNQHMQHGAHCKTRPSLTSTLLNVILCHVVLRHVP